MKEKNTNENSKLNRHPINSYHSDTMESMIIDNIFYALLLYMIFGGIATIIDWGSFALTHYSLGWHYSLSVLLSFSLGSITNFTLNKYLNFKNKSKRILLQSAIYLSIAMLVLIITLCFMAIFIDILNLPVMIARIITTAIVLFYNFLGHKYITFKLK